MGNVVDEINWCPVMVDVVVDVGCIVVILDTDDDDDDDVDSNDDECDNDDDVKTL